VDGAPQLSPECSDENAFVLGSANSPAATQTLGRKQLHGPGFLAVLVLAALCAWSFNKGNSWAFHNSEDYFWVSTYAHGLVRRGLIGTLLVPLLQHADLTRLMMIVLAINRAGLGLITMVLLLAVARQTRHSGAAWVLAALFASAPFMGQTAFLVGFPDGLVALMLAALTAAAWRGPPILVLALAVTAALFHEFVPLVALPGVCLAACLRQGIGMAARAAMVASVLAVILWASMAGHAPQDAVETLTRRLVGLGETPTEAFNQARWRLTQSTSDDFAMVSALWRALWLNGLIGLVYATTPALVMCLLGYPRLVAAMHRAGGAWDPAWRRAGLTGLYAAACLSPLAILLIAIDLSRLAGFTALTSLLTLFSLPPAKLPRAGRSVSAFIVAIFILLPVYCLHLQYGYAAHLRLLSPVCPACARGFVGALNFYNRGQSQAQRDEVLTSPAYFNGPP
jgi:hypothetical protein